MMSDADQISLTIPCNSKEMFGGMTIQTAESSNRFFKSEQRKKED